MAKTEQKQGIARNISVLYLKTGGEEKKQRIDKKKKIP